MISWVGVRWKDVGFGLLTATLLAMPAGAQQGCAGDDCNATEVAAQSVRVGYSQFPPFSETNVNGVAEGYSIDLIRMLLAPQGYTLDFVPFNNPAEMLEALSSREIDLTTILADNPARREVGAFTEHVGNLDVRVFVAAENADITSPDQLVGLTVGAAEGSIGYRLIGEIEGVSVVPLSSGVDSLLALLLGDVDAIVNSVESLNFLANQAQLSHRIKATDVSLRSLPVALLAEPSQTQLVEDLNAAITTALSNRQIERLYNSYFAARAAPFTWRERYAVFGAAVAILAALAYWARLHYIVLKRAQRMEAQSQLFGEALDATGLPLIIFDEEMRPAHWNEAFKRNYPKQIPLVQKGMDMETLMRNAMINGTIGEPLSSDEAAAEAKHRVEQLRAGAELVLLHETEDGKSFRRKTALLPNGFFVSIAADVTEIVASQRSLEAAHAKLESANRSLGDFNRIAAHDLMAPLRNVRNLHGWIRDDIEDMGFKLDEETVQNLESVDILLDRQSKMIEDLLVFSSTDGSQNMEPFNPSDRFAAVLGLANVPTGFVVNLPSDTPQVHVNPTAFDIVLRNLISNAVKHHDRDSGQIDISSEVEGAFCVLSVRDDGPGIPEKMLEKVFEPLVRLKSRDAGAGSGLGLAFIKRRVEEWGGHATAVSQDGKRGTTFRFTVPLADQSDNTFRKSRRVLSRPHGLSNASTTRSA